MRKTLTFRGVSYLISGFIGVIAGLWMISAIPESWIIGMFILLVGFVFIGIGLLSKREVREESEKPIMDVTTASNDEEEGS